MASVDGGLWLLMSGHRLYDRVIDLLPGTAPPKGSPLFAVRAQTPGIGGIH